MGEFKINKEGRGGSHVILERGNLAESSDGTRNSHEKCQHLGVNFDQLMAILVLKKIMEKKNNF